MNWWMCGWMNGRMDELGNELPYYVPLKAECSLGREREISVETEVVSYSSGGHLCVICTELTLTVLLQLNVHYYRSVARLPTWCPGASSNRLWISFQVCRSFTTSSVFFILISLVFVISSLMFSPRCLLSILHWLRKTWADRLCVLSSPQMGSLAFKWHQWDSTARRGGRKKERLRESKTCLLFMESWTN